MVSSVIAKVQMVPSEAASTPPAPATQMDDVESGSEPNSDTEQVRMV